MFETRKQLAAITQEYWKMARHYINSQLENAKLRELLDKPPYIAAKKYTIPIGDIRIRKSFADSEPAPEKIQECEEFYRTYGRLDRDIVLTESNVLVDGYIGYIVAQNSGAEKIKVLKIYAKR